MGDLSGVKVGDELVVVGARGGNRLARVVGAGPKWLHVEPEFRGSNPIRIARKDGRSEGGFVFARTLAEQKEWDIRSAAHKKLQQHGVSIPIGWSASELVALADAVEKIKGGSGV